MTRRMKLRARALCLVATSTLGLLIANDQLLRMSARQNPSSRVNWLFQSPPTKYGIAVLGSSMAKEGVDPLQLSAATGQRVVQLAWGGRGVSEQALTWEIFLERNKCDVLLLELHPRGLERSVLPHPLDEFRYIPRLSNPTIRRHLDRQFGSLQTSVWRWVPMWAMAEFSTQIGWHDVLALRRHTIFDPNSLADNKTTAAESTLRNQRYDSQRLPGASEIDPVSVEQFLEIVALCRAKKITVIAFAPPIFEGYRQSESGTLVRYKKLLGEGIEIVIPEAPFLYDPECFQDAFHVNRAGNQPFTAIIANHLALRSNHQAN